ncbi:M61 family metallopeptidase [Brevundimonas staleyi]|uniref:M61 family metallopeptidase n=1 Tax=Brevundimonas staleyi TaxID=74326 RepID=A0ABW0FN49_9CAUL
MSVRRLLTAAASAALMTGVAQAQEYRVSFDNAVHHEAQVSVTYRDVGSGPVRFQMSRSSPGRYAIHEFAKNVYSVSAVDGRGRDLTIDRTDPYGWTVPGHDGTVTLSYTLFADRSDGTYAQIDATHAHLNMPATLAWATGFDDRPVEIVFKPYDDSWKVATQLEPGPDPFTFAAPNLQYLMDSPVELSNHMVRQWTVDDAGVPRTLRLAVHHAGTEEEMDVFAERAKKVVDAQIAVFGDAPDFDFGTYTFIADYLPYVNGDGMEHRNSTVINNTRSFKEADFAQIGTLSHEFFHAWNVERIRPAELEPFDFTRANATPSLWFAEGFTNYYGPLTIRRAGVSTVDRFLADIGNQVNGVSNASGRRYGSPQEMSLRAPFVDAATAIDPVNDNIFVSYYPYGAVIALGLDLTLRQRFPGVTLDDLMRRMWQTHGITERAYRPEDLQTALTQVTGDAAFAEDFFARMIRGRDLPDFAPLLAQAGVSMEPVNPDAAWAGAARLPATGAPIIGGAVAPGTPLYEAGLDRGDQIVALGETEIDDQAGWIAALAAAKPGDDLPIRFLQRGVERSATLHLVADPSFRLVRMEADGEAITPAQQAFRDAWLGVPKE